MIRLMLLLLPLAAWADLPQASVSPPPGRYTSAVTVAVDVPEGTAVFYRFLETSDQRSLPWVAPLTLDAMPGETRGYTLRLTTQLRSGEAVVRDFAYTVVRAAPAYPSAKPVPGTYTSRVEFQPSLPEGWSLYQDGQPAQPGVLDAPDGSRRTYVFEARGPGQSAVWTYDIDKRDQEAALDVLSPVAGTWANAQQLVVVFRGLDRVVWAYGDRAGETAAEYQGPVTLKTGSQTVTVAGRARDGRWVERHVSWTSGTADLPAGWPAPGARTAAADFPEASGWSFSWDEGRSWAAAARSEEAPPASRKIVVVQARSGEAVSRLVYWFDVRAPQQPELRFEGGWNPRLLFSGSPDAVYRVAWQTSAPSNTREEAPIWGPLGSWKVPDGVTGAKVTVKAANGTSAEASIAFAETGWSVPRWETWDQNSGPRLPVGGRVVGRPGFLAAYEVSSAPDVAEPGPASAWLDGAFLPTVPWGADRTFYVRFAWRDATGLTGPPSPVYAIRVDRLPPVLPAVSENAGSIVASAGDADLFWAVTADRVPDADGLAFQPYKGPISRASLGSGAWFHVRAQDSAGNIGPARLNVALTGTPTGVVQVDPDPSVGETPVADGGVYAWPEFRLRSETPGLWVGAADARTGLPPTWSAELQPWTGVFVRSAQGERRSYLVYWNLKTSDGWAWPSPKSLTLTLDRGPPAAPVLPAWPSGALSQPWTLAMKPGQAGDSLRYSFTLDGSTPADPLLSGQPWPGSRTWQAPEGLLTTLRLRIAAVSASGMSAETPVGAVQFDRRAASPVSIPLEPFTYRNQPLTVPGTAGIVRYTLTADGTTPPAPGADSPLVGEGLKLSGKIGQTVLYRFRWRAYSTAGEPGPVTDTYSVLIDLTQSVPVSGQAASGAAPALTGIPESGISSAPVTVSTQWPGVARYELQEGPGSPPAVTAGSPVLTAPITLGAPGIDRTYSLNVRGFSPEGQPLTDEAHSVVRVDLSVPAAPLIELTAGRTATAELTQLSADPDETLEYRWLWQSFPTGQGETDWSRSPATFAAPSGEMTRVTVQARLRDEAGNVGPVTEKSVFLDQNVVYVAAGPAGDGSRISPASSMASAIALARASGRSVLFVAGGSYAVDGTLDIGGLKVYGGWSKDQWQLAPASGRAVWTQSSAFTGTSLIRTSGKDWTLSGVDLFAAKGLAQVVSVQGGSIEIRDSSWTWGSAGQGWVQSGGTLSATRISAIFNAQPRGAFLSLDSVTASLSALNLAAGSNQESMLFACRDSRVSVAALVVVSKDGTGYDGVWQSDGGTLAVDGARILAGEGASRSLAFRLKNAEATLNKVDLSLFASGSNTAFQLTGGVLSVGGSSVSLLKGTEFNQIVVADHSRTSLSEFTVKIESGTYQTAFNLDGGSLSLSSGTVSVAGGGKQALGGRFRGGSLVNFDDVTWVLVRKTPGQIWLNDTPWAEGSRNFSTVKGW